MEERKNTQATGNLNQANKRIYQTKILLYNSYRHIWRARKIRRPFNRVPMHKIRHQTLIVKAAFQSSVFDAYVCAHGND
jgi:hypothetical protein